MDLYKVLGVSRHASQDEVKRAFRKLALECHPDRNAGGSKASAEQAEQRFRAVSEAYEVLGNESKRDLYNRGQATGYPHQTAGSWNSATNQQYYAPPRARSGWSNFRSQQQKRKQAGMPGAFASILRNMTRVDTYFHLLLAGSLVGGLLLMNTAGESMWNSINKGKLFKDLPETQQPLKQKAKSGKDTKPPVVPADDPA